MGKIVVVGSFVYDLMVWLPYFPRKGETLLASDFKMAAGGKGFNQAVAARRCGAEVSMVGKVGGDQFGDEYMKILDREGINRDFVIRDPSTSTSLGIPMIDPHGDNAIIGIPRANTIMRESDVEIASQFIALHQLLLIQNEIPLDTSLKAARIAHQAGMTVIYNPAPAAYPLSQILQKDDLGQPIIDWFMPNEVEAEMLTNISVENPEGANKAADFILSKGVGKGVVITMGEKGSIAKTRESQYHIPAIPVTPVDPTGAGDAFCGSFAVGLADEWSIERALRFANAAGALAVTKAGAEPSLPTREAIEAFMHRHS